MPRKEGSKDSKSKPKQKKTANGFAMALKVPLGEVLTDMCKKKWVVGPPIGQGGFGTIYSAREESSSSKDYPFAVKIEPHENGPLFVEMHIYMKYGKPELINDYVKQKKLPYLNLPVYHGSGSHEVQGIKHRFVVTNKFGSDLWSMFKTSKKFPFGTVLSVAKQTLQVLEYIHSKGYAHCDVKGANLLIGNTPSTKNRVYLVDFGLATKCIATAEYIEDARKTNNGTIEYLSRDAHRGVVTKRGDLEVLAFNMIHWLCSTLPWEQVIAMDKKGKEKTVEEMKNKFMDNILEGLNSLKFPPTEKAFLKKFLERIKGMSHLDTPDYKAFNKMMMDAMKETGMKESSPLVFSATKTSPRGAGSKAKSSKRAIEESEEEVEEEASPPKKKRGKAGEKSTATKQPRGRNQGAQASSKVDDGNDLQSTPQKAEKTPKGRKARQSMSSEEENLMDGIKPEKPKPKRLGRSVLAKMEADKAAAAAQKNGTANGSSSSSSKGSETTPEKKSKKRKGAERNKGTGKWKLCPTVINSNVETPGTYSPPADAPSRNKKK